MKRVLGYVRVSTSTQDLQRQKDLIAEYCNEKGYILVGIEKDYAISGAKSDRDGLNKVLAVDNSLIDMVVVSELSRISRQDDIVNTLQQIHQIISKVDLVILDDRDKIYKAGEILSLTDFLMLAIKAYGAADERKKIKERMHSGIDTKFAKCVMMGVASVPYGFKLVDNPDYERGKTSRKLFDVDEATIKVVKQMYQYVLDGYSINQITDMLNSQRIGGKRFEASNVRYILHNKFYNGKRLFKGQYYDMPIKVIDDYTWNLVQEKLKSNRAYSYEAQKKHFNPLKGILKCPCGANMTIIYGHNKSGYTMILSCADKARRLKTNCKNNGIRGEYLFNIVWKDVYTFIFYNSMVKKDSENPYKVKSNETIKKLQTELQQLQYALPPKEKAIEDKTREIETVANNMASVTNAIALDTLNKKVNELQGELNTRIKERNKLERLIVKTEARIKEEEKMLTVNELNNITEEGKAEIYKRVLERVTYYSFNGHHKGYIEIVFKNGIISRHLYSNSNKNCYSWALPPDVTIDRERMVLYLNKEALEDRLKGIENSSVTVAEFQKQANWLRTTHK
jgi:site-specific DNA recombinase